MWSIVWSIRGQLKHHTSTFETSAKAHTFARYYQSVFERHRRFGYVNDRFLGVSKLHSEHPAISYRLIQNQ